jgi:hypothetical protein
MGTNTLSLNKLAVPDTILSDTVIDDGPTRINSPEKPAPAFDEKKPYAQVCGVEGSAFYLQGQWYYNRAKQPVRPAPLDQMYNPQPKKMSRAEAEAKRQAGQVIKKEGKFVPAEPESIVQARREDFRARRAEDQAA